MQAVLISRKLPMTAPAASRKQFELHVLPPLHGATLP
jgi:hypothetical protein